MHKFLLPLALLATSTVFAQAIRDVPFYFAVTEEAHLTIKDTGWAKIPVKGVKSDKAFLRGYTFLDNALLKSAAQVKIRQAAFKQLLAKQIIQTGDVVLSFRPSWENTIPYSHIQMGISHAGVAYVENGVVKNLDMPLDAEYNGNNISSGFDSPHYLETNHLHILRPRDFGLSKKNNLKSWVQTLRKNYTTIRAKGLLKFNPDYSAAKIDKFGPKHSFVTTMGRIFSGKDTTSTSLTMFCSESSWALMSLANCAPTDTEIADGIVQSASCVAPIFEAMYMTANKGTPGLTEGPLALLESLDISASEKNDLMKQLFTQGEMSGLSSGHKALATNPAVQGLMKALQGVYPAKLNGQDAAVAGITAQINQQGGRNYSPTSFLINAMLGQTDPERKFDYVATIIFTPKL